MAICSLKEIKRILKRDENKRRPLLGIDHGTKNIGIAVSDSNLSIATPLTTIRSTKFSNDIKELKKIIDEYSIVAIIIGLPLNMDGSEGARCQSVRQYAKNLLDKKDFFERELEIAFWDERLSSFAVDRMLIEDTDISRKKRATVIDKLAASHILQGALDFLQK